MFALSRREASARALLPGDRPPIFFPLIASFQNEMGVANARREG